MQSYSVGIPVRNEEKTIEDSINAVLTQTRSPEEVLICINGSTDRTSEIVNKISKNENRIRILESEEGIANAWNRLFEQSQTNFLGFTDADVKVRQNAFELLLNEVNNFSVVGGSIIRKFPKKKTFFTKISDQEFGINIRNRYLCGQLYMINKKKIQENATNLEIPLIPADTINTTQLISLIASYNDSINMIEEALVEINPLLTFEDFVNMRKRISKGRRQLECRYPELYQNTQSTQKRFEEYLNRFKQAKAFEKVLGTILLGTIRECIYQTSKYNSSEKDVHLWEPTYNSKVSF